MSQRYDGQVVVVTGGASGIGAASAEAFHTEGARVVVADVQEDAGATLAARLGERALFVRTDVGDEGEVAGLVDTTVAHFGRLNVFFANAGVMGAMGSVARLRVPDVEATVGINLLGVIWSMKHAARVMLEQGSGVILATSSPAGVVGGVGPHVYSATKAGVIGLVQSVAAELRPHGIRVNTIVPGAVLSAMTADIVAGDPDDLAGAATKLTPARVTEGTGMPEHIAAAALFLGSEDAAFVTAATFHVDGGYCQAPGESPFASGKWADPQAVYEAGRHR